MALKKFIHSDDSNSSQDVRIFTNNHLNNLSSHYFSYDPIISNQQFESQENLIFVENELRNEYATLSRLAPSNFITIEIGEAIKNF